MDEIEKLIAAADPEKIVKAALRRDMELTVDAVYKWKKRGQIPLDYWDIVMKLAGVSLDKIYAINKAMRQKKAA